MPSRSILPLLLALVIPLTGISAATAKPNVLFIAVDDLNHWVGHLKRNPQTITPNLDRLASWGVSFAHAYCAAPACNPSRTALMSGRRPSSTGVYQNPDDYRPHIPPEQTLNSHFRAHGYRVTGAGKIYHSNGGRRNEWDDFARGRGDRAGGATEREAVGALEWAMLEGGDDVLNDFHAVSYCIDELGKPHEQPFFIGCGLFRPHLPWHVPRSYFDLHPLESIELPPHDPNDLEDVPPAGRSMARPNGDHRAVVEAGAWKRLVRGYLASISYADAQLGRLLNAVEKSPERDRTIIVLWGDHGWHLGEKSHWRKFALWEEATRAPLIWVVPGVTPRGAISRRTVDFMSMYPTLCELAGLPVPAHVEGPSLVPLLKDPAAPWDRPALTTHGFKNHAVRSEGWRLIRYADGSEELYHETVDPFERTNRAADATLAGIKAELAKWFPTTDAPQVTTRYGNAASRDQPDGNDSDP